MRKYLLTKYSQFQLFTIEHLSVELLIPKPRARELQQQVLGSFRPMDFEQFLMCIEVGIEV